MHDDYVVGYSVNLKEKNVIIKTQSNCEIKFSGVLTHSFKCILDYNQILDINECDINSFIDDNQEELMQLKDSCWPIPYQTTQELLGFITDNMYKYIKIYSSYGMFGWILAKSYQVGG